MKNPKQRPTAGAVCDKISHLFNAATVTPPKSLSSPSCLITPTHSIPQPLTFPTSITQLPDGTSITQPIPNPFLDPILQVKSKSQPHAQVQASPSHPSPLPQNPILHGHTNWVYCATFLPDRKYIVSGSHDQTIMIWDVQTSNLVLGSLKRHTAEVGCVAFSPNSREIASGSGDKTILVWDAVTGTVVAGPFKGHTDLIGSVCFSPDGRQLSSASGDKTIRVWDTQTGDLLVGPLKGHTDFITYVTFSKDGKQLASGSVDKTIRIWDAESGRLICGPLKWHHNVVWFVGSLLMERKLSQHHGMGMSVFGMQIQELMCLGLQNSTLKAPLLWCSCQIAHFIVLSHLMGSG